MDAGRKKKWVAWAVAAAIFVVLMLVTPAIPQDEAYHDFADQRTLFLDSKHSDSNLAASSQGELWSWTLFFVGATAVGFGSSYYHLNPNDATLVWDRLPMTIAFTSVMAIFIIERVDERAGFYLLAKVEEAADKPIYNWTHQIVSGHTLKHLCAAMVPVFLALMLAKRTIEPERVSLLQKWKISWVTVRERRSKDSSTVDVDCNYAAVSNTTSEQ
ncbi:unnamed protein product [Miscanthus lutarioriparius]|uniref:Alkaline phytoceramidase n=1 Tax=Miscanthus lutarioriparius TaxID=422564 RepID=A0A811NQ42_9POAL|nr:unnamed protein product [Miscanthus lutarioriparius]